MSHSRLMPITKKSILIIDDNADMRQLLLSQLNGQYHCLCAENGQTGLEVAQQQLPDLIVSDIMMPLMDGYELTEKLKSDEMTSHIPIILLTAKGGIQSRLKGLKLLVDDYVAKPFNLTELELRIQGLLSIREILSKRAGQQAVNTMEDESTVNELELQFLNKLNSQLNEHYSNPELTTALISQSLNISEKQLQRKLKACYDQTFPEWVRYYRLNMAAKQLEQGHRASQIYYSVGFGSHAYFSKCFKAHFGCTPKQYLQAKTVNEVEPVN
jgi:DNA-binding response OmpR family regulator